MVSERNVLTVNKTGIYLFPSLLILSLDCLVQNKVTRVGRTSYIDKNISPGFLFSSDMVLPNAHHQDFSGLLDLDYILFLIGEV